MSITFYTEPLLSNDSAYLAYSVNMSNTNALRVLDLLRPASAEDSYEDYSGAMPTADFHAATLLALALTPADAGVPATTIRQLHRLRTPGGVLADPSGGPARAGRLRVSARPPRDRLGVPARPRVC